MSDGGEDGQEKTVTAQVPMIISVDDHLVEPPDLWQRRLPSKFRDAGPRVVSGPWEMVPDDAQARAYKSSWSAFRPASDGPVTDWWLYEDHVSATLIGNAAAGLPPDAIVAGPIRFAEMRPGCHEVRGRLDDMDRNHTERSLCFPTFPRFCGQTFLEGKDRRLALACVRAYNDFMVEEWAGESGGRLLPLCLIPLWDGQLAADEVRLNAARGVHAVAFSELPAKLGLPSIHDPDGYWLPFFHACEETGTVICMHIGSSSQIPVPSDDAPAHVPIALTTINAQISMADWLLSGHLARLPNLRLAYSEGQIGWIPFLLERLDTLWRKHHYRDEWDAALNEPPSHYARRHIWGCFFEDDFGLTARDVIGVDVITYETDYPHQDSTWPDSKEYAERAMGHLPQADVDKICRGNAIELFGLPPELPSSELRSA